MRSALAGIAVAYGLANSAVSLSAADLDSCRKQLLTGEYRECIAAVDAAVAAEESRDAEWPQLKIHALLALGRYPEALAALETALTQYRESLTLHLIGREVYRRNGNPQQGEAMLAEITAMLNRTPWRYSDSLNLVAVGRTALLQGTDPRQVLEVCYDRARKQAPPYREVFLATGELALEKHDDGVAADAFKAGLKLFPDDADMLYGLGRSLTSGDGEKAEAAFKAAIAANPRHVPTLLLQVDNLIDAEQYAEAEEALDAILAVNPWQPQAWTYRAVMAHLDNAPSQEELYRRTALHFSRRDPEVDHLLGKKLSQKYRFAEGSAYQRRALAVDPKYLPAKIQLSQDLLRLGEEDEGWQLANEVHALDGYDTSAFNLVTLHDNLSKFRTLTSDDFLVRMETRESHIYGDRVMSLLQRAKSTLCKKYDLDLKQPVTVEIFPEQSDFAVRTFGMPGGIGYLGVCFGRVITANSPASQGETPANWESVLWHEFCHAVTLEITKNKMPRWLSEGISVYEERQEDPTWGQSMSPRYRELILGDKLTPVGQLSSAFLRPKTPLDLQFAYYESSLVVEYLVGRYGHVALKRILLDLGAGVPVNEALGRHTGSLAEFEKDFAAYAKQQAEALAPKGDWEKLDLPEEPAERVAGVLAWLKDHPNSIPALLLKAEGLIEAEEFAAAKEPLFKVMELCPSLVGGDNVYEQLALVHRQLKETAAEREVLERWLARDDDAIDACLRAMELAVEAKDWPAVDRYAKRLLAVNPLLAEPHKQLARASEELKNRAEAIVAYRTLLQFDPADPAEAHFRLARLLHEDGDPTARRHVLMALEEAPRFREAQQLLLKIVAGDEPPVGDNQ